MSILHFIIPTRLGWAAQTNPIRFGLFDSWVPADRILQVQGVMPSVFGLPAAW